MKTLKNKEMIDAKNTPHFQMLNKKQRIKEMEDYGYIKYKDVKQAVLEFKEWLEDINYEIEVEKIYDKHKEIFGDFEE